MPTINDITGDTIATRQHNQEAFSEGWDRIWGNKEDKSLIEEKEEQDARHNLDQQQN